MLTNIKAIEPNAIYTVPEAAELLKLGNQTVRKLARSGQIDCIRVGKRVLRFKGSALLAFTESGGSAGPVNVIPDQVRRRPRLAS